MEIAVKKGSYAPISLSTSMSGMKITMHDLSFGVDEKLVTFNIDYYPEVTVIDKR